MSNSLKNIDYSRLKMGKVNLDALIPREDFEVIDNPDQNPSRTATISLNNLKNDDFFFFSIRKPDFQRETNEWDSDKVVGFIESFVNGDLIPSVILWNTKGSYTFVIDGAHRLSALAAWINDDYGDGPLSKRFFDGVIPEEQIKIAEKTRLLARKRIGSYVDYKLALTNPEKVSEEINKKSKTLGVIGIQVQWVNGGATTAENSFFKINQEAVPINPTELILLRSRKKPNGMSARAIIRSGTGHKYWSKFTKDKQENIERLSKEINNLIFVPPLKKPIKSIELPLAGKPNSSQAQQLVLNFVNMANELIDKKEDEIPEDADGSKTLKYLKTCKKIAQKINSTETDSFGLHPAVYLYSKEGNYKLVSFYAVVDFIYALEDKNLVKKFISVRKYFEDLILEHDFFIPQIVRKYRSGTRSYPFIREFFVEIINKLSEGKSKDDVINEILKQDNFKYLKTENVEIVDEELSNEFSVQIKSAVVISEQLKNALRCKICGARVDSRAITIDHIQRKSEEGKGTIENAQISHPYCNNIYKR